MDVTATVWTLLPPIIAIALALITKEVYSSLMIGILSGALLYTGFHPLKAVETTFTIMGSKLGDNINICIFLVGSGGRLVPAGIEHAGRLLAVPQDHPVEPVRAADARVPHLADGC